MREETTWNSPQDKDLVSASDCDSPNHVIAAAAIAVDLPMISLIVSLFFSISVNVPLS